jgi:thiamine transport system substrate-binding protein
MKNMNHKTGFIILLAVLFLTACTLSPAAPGTPPPPVGVPQTLTVMTHDSFSISKEIAANFEAQNNVKLSFVKGGDAGAVLNKAILSRESPLADVFYGFDNTFLSRALESGIFESYQSPMLDVIPREYQLDSGARALPVDFGDVCINYDQLYFSNRKLPLPQKLEDLTKPIYSGLLVVENPATSSPGLAFLLATIAHFGPDQYLEYWKLLRSNNTAVANGWETAYYTNFSGSSGKGSQSMVVSYASSPAAEVIFATTPMNDPPTGSLLFADMCFRQIEFVGILKGTRQRQMAEKFVDFMLSPAFQEDMPEQMFVYPVHPSARLPETFQKYAAVAKNPARMDPAEISKNRDAWIKAWTDVFLK